MGITSATSAAATLHMSYPNIRMAFIVGICGGVPSTEQGEVHLGDVAVSTLVVQYDSGRQYHERFVVRNTAEDSNGRPAKGVRSLLALIETNHHRKRLLVQAAAHLQRLQEKAIAEDHETNYQEPPEGSDWSYPAGLIHKHHETSNIGECPRCTRNKACPQADEDSCETCGCSAAAIASGQTYMISPPHRPLKIVLGRIGSANMVLKSSADRDRLSRAHKLVAFEMEVAGVWDEMPTLMVKGVCDYAGSHKNKSWQTFAAARAAAVTRALIEKLHLDDPPNASPAAAAASSQNSHALERGSIASHGRQAPGSRTMPNITMENGSLINQGDVSGSVMRR